MTEVNLQALQNKVRQIEIISNRLVAEQMAGQYHSVFKGQGIEFEEVRPYIIGDDIRSIDWNVTARAREVHVKRFREERERSVFLVVDVSASCRFGTRNEFKSELMAEICAVLAFAAIANDDRIGLLLCSDHPELVVPPRKGRRHTLRLVREVLGFQPKSSGTDLGLALEHLRQILRRRSIVFLISDFLGIDYERPLSMIARHHDLIAIAVEDPMEMALPNVGLMDLVDAESGEVRTVDSGDAKFRSDFQAQREQRREQRNSMMLRNEVDLIELNTGEDYAAALVLFFRRRARRARM